MAKAKKSSAKKKRTLKIDSGIAYIQASFNNTIISITDDTGAVLTWQSGGTVGFKGTRKATPFAAQLAAEEVVKRAKAFGLKTVKVLVKGPGGGRETAIRTLQAGGLDITTIKDITPVPHNGCRPKKKRRV